MIAPVAAFAMRIALRAPRHGEINVVIDRPAFPAVNSGYGADHRTGIQHMIIEGKIIAGHDIHANRLLPRPDLGAQLRGHAEQIGPAGFAGPVFFKRGFQLAARADAGEAKRCNGNSHDST